MESKEARAGLATPEEVAAFLGTTPVRLGKQRHFGNGPLFIKDGRRVLYRWSDVERYLDEQTFQQTPGR